MSTRNLVLGINYQKGKCGLTKNMNLKIFRPLRMSPY